MSYWDFVKLLKDQLILEVPTMDEYAEFIEPVYEFHPVLNVPNAKEKTAQMYAFGGLGIFKVLLPEAEEFAAMEDSLRNLAIQMEEMKREYDNLSVEYHTKCNDKRKEWRCA